MTCSEMLNIIQKYETKQRADPEGRTLRKKSEADQKCMLMENCEVEKVHSSKFHTAGRAASRKINCRACAGITR